MSIMTIQEYISNQIEISSEVWNYLNSVITKVNVKKGELCIGYKESSNKLFFIEKGFLRAYHYEDGKEITDWFAQEDEFATCFHSFIYNKPSLEFIEAGEDCELYLIEYSELQKIYKTFPETERIGRVITERYYVKLEQRLQNLKLMNAKGRYRHLLQNNPELLRRAPLGHIASYLGITQETLSRIRAEM